MYINSIQVQGFMITQVILSLFFMNVFVLVRKGKVEKPTISNVFWIYMFMSFAVSLVVVSGTIAYAYYVADPDVLLEFISIIKSAT